jgi:hypothetical protein
MSTSAAAAMAKKRVRRQKQILAVGTVCLLAILGYQLPKLLGGRGSQAESVVTTSVATATSSSLAGSSPLVASGKLPDTDRISVQRDTGQLLSFGLFKSKDPFVQQMSATASSSAATPAAPAPARAPTKKAKSAATPGAGVKTSTGPAAPSVITQPAPTPASPGTSTTPVISPTPLPVGSAPGTTTPAAPSSTPASVLVSTNGVCEQVALKGTFPAKEDIFRLVEIAKNGKSIKIAIVGGSYDSGQAAATVKLGEKLTLVNTSDGSRYVIVLEAKCAATGSGAAPATSTPPVKLPAPAPATPTTPIVTDSYDTPPAPSS